MASINLLQLQEASAGEGAGIEIRSASKPVLVSSVGGGFDGSVVAVLQVGCWYVMLGLGCGCDDLVVVVRVKVVAVRIYGTLARLDGGYEMIGGGCTIVWWLRWNWLWEGLGGGLLWWQLAAAEVDQVCLDRLKSESCNASGTKACREKMRRDKLNERHDIVFSPT
ncbi:hypothetical protein RJ639_006045 [Escallonia herrerae]|uniref:Uncharacterized protein n=1 Tax=Escallonia herrerae TaxID=1293975 RepID=A0AA89AU21_9ASTE|nr:hypothetical protein RJ639_006045 [Escallonia herrerae]